MQGFFLSSERKAENRRLVQRVERFVHCARPRLSPESPCALKQQGFLSQPQRFQRCPQGEVCWLLSVRRKTFWLTNSGSGQTKALGQGMPRFRSLDKTLHRSHHARFHTCPVRLGDGRETFCWIKKGQQTRRVEIALDRPDPARTLMPALG